MHTMRATLIPLVIGLVLKAFAAEPEFPLTEDSKVQPNIPQGELIKGSYTAKEGSVFPGTEREYTIYLPAGFAKDKPSPFMVFQDGVIYNAPVVFDNLIAKKQIPPLIGIFIKPGVVPAANPNALPRYNRSYEYDSVTDTYSRFLLDEFLPAIQKKHELALSTDPNDAAIAGNSSGGICAFMVAWHRPDRIRRVFTGVGTYVGIRGADQLPVLIRKVEPKPLRVFLQSGEHDNDLYCGDWWMANQMMERSLTWAGYDVNHTWGEGGHNSKHATAIFPDVLRWLWRDYDTAKEIKVNPRGESKWRGHEVIGDGKWEKVHVADESFRFGGLCANIQGDIFVIARCQSTPAAVLRTPLLQWRAVKSAEPTNEEQILKIKGSGGLESYQGLFLGGSKPAILPNGEVLVSCYSRDNKGLVVAKDGELKEFSSEQILTPTVAADGSVYAQPNTSIDWPKYYQPGMYALNAAGKTIFRGELKTEEIAWFVATTLSPDQTQLFAAGGDYLWNFQISPDHTVRHGQQFSELQMNPFSHSGAFARGLCVDTNGWLYVATALGIQVCDQAGRVNFIIPTPQQPHDICFGGKDLGELFIACGDKIYKRPTKAHGIVSGQMAPIKPKAPKL